MHRSKFLFLLLDLILCARCKLSSFPEPSFRTSFAMASQEGRASYREVYHRFGALPHLVRVYARPEDGANDGFAFEGVGSAAQARGNAYGGLIFAFDDTRVRIWAPSRNNGSGDGRIVWIGTGWAGNKNGQSSQRATVIVEAWKTGPRPSWSKSITMTAQTIGSYQELISGLGSYPERIEVTVKALSGNNSGFLFYGAGAGQCDDSSSSYGGVVFAYSYDSVRLWTAHRNDGTSRGYCLLVDDGWGEGVNSQQSTICDVTVSVWLDELPPPSFISSWVAMESQKRSDSYKEIWHGLGAVPTHIKIQVRAVNGNNAGFIFEAIGSIMKDDTDGGNYGGLAFSYDSNVVRLWAPSKNLTSDKGRLIMVQDGWGREINSQASNKGEVRVVAWTSCKENEGSLYEGYCRQNSVSRYEWMYDEWGECSAVCGRGTETRLESGCLSQNYEKILSCDFGQNKGTLCGFTTTKQDITREIPEWKLRQGATTSTDTGPSHDHTTGSGYYVYTETSNIGKGGLGILTSPDIQGDSSCELTFYWLSHGSDVGVLSVEILSVGASWKTVWKTYYEHGLVWRRAWIPLDEYQSFTKVRFVHEVGKPSSSKTNAFQGDAAIDDIIMTCHSRNSKLFNSTLAECRKYQFPIPGCTVSAKEYTSTGPAYSINSSNGIDYVKASGIQSDVVADYKFNVIQPGGYLLWMQTVGNQSSTRISIDGRDTKEWDTGGQTEVQWHTNPTNVLQLGSGIHTISIQQVTFGFQFSTLAIISQQVNSYEPLGLQSFLVPDSSLSASHSTASKGCSSLGLRLHSASGWCSDETHLDTYITVILPRLAMINQIAYQGLPTGSDRTTEFQVDYSLDGLKFDTFMSGSSLPYIFKEDPTKHGVQSALFPYVLPAKALRIIPKSWVGVKALRVELYGRYADDGTCTRSGPVDVKQPCAGDAQCSAQGQCNSSQSDHCVCSAGFYGDRCYGDYCSPNPCKSNGTCFGAEGGLYCDCPPGRTGLLCENSCELNHYGRNCANACNCSARGTCDPRDGSCSCFQGYKGDNCEKPCDKGTFGLLCRQSCTCKNAAGCDHVTGKCSCTSGFYGAFCDIPCNGTAWGPYCTAVCNCRNGALCDGITGKCDCLAGYNGSDCSQECPSGLYGKDCVNKCKCQNGGLCDKSTGACTCVSSGFTGVFCDQPCPLSKWGRNCQNACSCSNGATCDSIDGACMCTRGWTGQQCTEACLSGLYGFNCSHRCLCSNGAQCNRFTGDCSCSSNCTCSPGWKGGTCDVACTANEWGPGCKEKCTCSAHGTCNRFDGTCSCLSGYVGRNCDSSCSAGFYGDACLRNCTCVVANTKSCGHTDGYCSCKAGWEGVTCGRECSHGYWGLGCAQACLCQNGADCDSVDGSCTCTPGYQGKYCDIPCLSGYYGIGCTKLCRCKHGKCNNTNGACTCSSGWHGVYCDSPCASGYYGVSCSKSCNCGGGSCDHVTGDCSCLSGYKGVTCSEICPNGTYGLNCASACPVCSHGQGVCHHVTGHCPCAPGYVGSSCTQTCPLNKYGIFCRIDCKCVHGQCDHVTGSCSCSEGYTGTYCSKVCPPGYYGRNCALKCACVHGSCESVTGKCTCSPGYTGSACNNPCSPGKYGLGCTLDCTCSNGASCNHTNGLCICGSGWMGPQCDRPCRAMSYGPNCALSCNCVRASECNRFTGDCLCLPGWQGATCSNACSEGLFGLNCSFSCDCGKGKGCHHETGQCVCPRGFTGRLCNQVCRSGFYGLNCTESCQCEKDNTFVGQQCNPITGTCNCKSGYAGNCKTSCPDFTFGLNCSSACACTNGGVCNPVNGSCACLPGYTGPQCETVCPSGFYGDNCRWPCDCLRSRANSCSPIDGRCECFPGYKGEQCQEDCSAGWFGLGCLFSCNCSSSHSSGCDAKTGKCLCAEGWMGPNCRTVCDNGWFGQNCQDKCKCANEGDCNRFTGHCDCKPGFTGKFCTQKCTGFAYGPDCGNMCNCSYNTTKDCHHVTGVCRCKPGYTGSTCLQVCSFGSWGDGCILSCPVCSPHIGGSCRPEDGSCICLAGFTSYYCNSDCPKGFYGINCTSTCHPCAEGYLCNHVHGSCQDTASSIFSIQFLAVYEDLLNANLQSDITTGLARLFSLYAPPHINTSYLAYGENETEGVLRSLARSSMIHNIPLPGARQSSFSGQYVMAYNSDFVARILNVKPSGRLDFVIYFRNWLVLKSKAIEILSPISMDILGQYFSVEVLEISTESMKDHSNSVLLPVLLSTGAIVLIIIAIFTGIAICRTRAKSKRPPVYEYNLKRKKSQQTFASTTSSRHHFNNLCYDIMAEIEIEDNLNETIANPLYRHPNLGLKEDEGKTRSSAVCEVDKMDTPVG